MIQPLFHAGIKIVINEIIQPYYTSDQVKFPKSKKKRICKKWAKRSCNFKLTLHDDFYVMNDDYANGRIESTIVMNQAQYDKLFQDRQASSI